MFRSRPGFLFTALALAMSLVPNTLRADIDDCVRALANMNAVQDKWGMRQRIVPVSNGATQMIGNSDTISWDDRRYYDLNDSNEWRTYVNEAVQSRDPNYLWETFHCSTAYMIAFYDRDYGRYFMPPEGNPNPSPSNQPDPGNVNGPTGGGGSDPGLNPPNSSPSPTGGGYVPDPNPSNTPRCGANIGWDGTRYEWCEEAY